MLYYYIPKGIWAPINVVFMAAIAGDPFGPIKKIGRYN